MSVITAEPPLVAANGRSRGAQLRRFARRNPTIVAGGAILGVITLLASAAPLFAGDAVTMQPALRLRPPSEANWLGTDHLGRDVFARTIYGAQVSLFVGISVAAVSISIGLLIGLLSGYFRKVDAVVMRLMDGLNAAARAAGVPFTTNHVCGMFGLFFSERPVRSFADVMACDVERFKRFFHAMLDEGIYLAPSAFEAGFISAAHSNADIDATIAAARRAFSKL